MWRPTTRQQHSRTVTRYQTDLTDAEWFVIAPYLPKPCAMGRPREWPMREIINGIFYVMRAGCSWRLLANDLPPWGTIYRWFAAWRDDGPFERINHVLVMADRERVGRRVRRDTALAIDDSGDPIDRYVNLTRPTPLPKCRVLSALRQDARRGE
jgi:transposase